MWRPEEDSPSSTSSEAACNMKRILLLAYFICAAAGQNRNFRDSLDGQYVHDPNDGAYVHDDSGQYIHDNSGSYIHDGTGIYTHIDNAYRHQDSGSFRDGRGRGFSDKFGNGKSAPSFSPNLVLIGSARPKQLHSKAEDDARRAKANSVSFDSGTFGNSPSGTSNNPSRRVVGDRYPKGKYDESKFRIIKQSGDIDVDGYHWDYETENGIVAEEVGKITNKGSKSETMRAKGFFKYIGPDNVVYHITYTADENGFQAKGNHLPTPPPIPAAILKTLDRQNFSS